MANLNKIMIIGNVGTDPEMRYTPQGTPVTSFRLATSRTYTTPEGERRQETEWFQIVTWNRLAENCNQFLRKCARISVFEKPGACCVSVEAAELIATHATSFGFPLL